MKIGFIGAGKMGGALARAVYSARCAEEIILSDPSAAAADLAKELHFAMASAEDVIGVCDYVFLGLKPQVLPEVAEKLGRLSDERVVFITMAAGVQIASLHQWLGKRVPVIRIMPNTPVSVGEGTVLYDCSAEVTAEQEKTFLKILSKAGRLDRLPEKLIDAGCAVSGCGPAFVCLFAEALADGGVACGLPREKAAAYAAQTLLGTARLLLESGENPGKLKDDVCSPGGSTIQGVYALEQGGFRGTVMRCVQKAFEKTVDLGKK